MQWHFNIKQSFGEFDMEKLTSTRINTWLSKRGLVTAKKVQTMVNKTVYKSYEFAVKLGIPLGSASTSFPLVEK